MKKKTVCRNEGFVAAGLRIAGFIFCLWFMAFPLVPSRASDDDARVRARDLIVRGKQLKASGDPGARHTLEQGVSLARSLGDQEILSDGLRAVAVSYTDAGDPAKGLELGEQALLSARLSGNSSLEARALQQIGNAYFYLHRHRNALEKFQASLSIVRGLADHRAEADLLKDIGIAYRNIGRFDDALEHLHEAREILATLDPGDLTASVQESIATCYTRLGANRLAIESYEQVLETSRRSGNKSLTFHILTRLGYLLAGLNEPERALQYFREGMAMAETAGSLRVQAWIMMGMTGPLAMLGRLDDAIEANRRSIELHRRMKSEMGLAQDLTSLAQLYVERDPSAALKYFHRSLAIYDRYDDQILWSTYDGMARAHRRLGEPARAIEYFQKAIDEIEIVRGHLTSDQHRASFLGKYEATYHALIESLIEQHQLNQYAGYDLRAYAVYESFKARSMSEAIAASRLDTPRELEPELRERADEVDAGIARLQKLLIEKRFGNRERRVVSDELRQAELDFDHLMMQARRRTPTAAGELGPLSPAQVQSYLDDRTALVAYLITGDRVFAFVITATTFQIKVLDVASAVLTARVENYVDLISGTAKGGWQDISARIHGDLLSPILSQIPGPIDSLIIVPDGVLHYLPFETLIEDRQSPADSYEHKSGKYLLEDFSVSYAPSAAVMVELSAQSRPSELPDRADVALFAGPEIAPTLLAAPEGEGSDGWKRLSYLDEGLRISPIPFSAAEADVVGRYGGEGNLVCVGSEASEHRVKTEALDRFRIIHFATHGLVSQQSPARSALVLSAGFGSEDGFLQAREIYNLKLASDLVILSACQTARGRVLAGEGVEGLAQAFLYAGARSVVASLWAVNDERTSRLMESFYKHLAAGRPKAEALRAAKLDLLHDASTAEPRYWASFILIGDANQQVPIQQRRQWVAERRWFLACCLMLSAIALLAPFVYKVSRRAKPAASAFGD